MRIEEDPTISYRFVLLSSFLFFSVFSASRRLCVKKTVA
jgi:hypothetical protein